MILVLAGFCLPMFGTSGGIFGNWFEASGFHFIAIGKPVVSCGAVCTLAGGILGIAASIFSIKKDIRALKMSGILISIIGGFILVVGFAKYPETKMLTGGILKVGKIGFYTVLVGWILGINGYLYRK